MKNSAKGIPVVISAPSGAGKSTIANQIIKDNPTLVLSTSCTTRPPRSGEQNGRDYFFTSSDDFKRKIEQGEFLEWAVVHGQYYGTPLSALKAKLEEGKDVVMTIDPQGALKVKQIYPDGVYIFVVPPSFDVLVQRLKKRATDDPTSMEIRIANARKELTYVSHYDYLIVNDALDSAVRDIKAIISSEHLRVSRVQKKGIPIFSQDR